MTALLAGLQCLALEQEGRVLVAQLNRPQALNALNDQMMDELVRVLDAAEQSDDVHVVILTGLPKVFAAGADISAMSKWSYMDVYKSDYVTRNWERLASFRKPIIAAVSGYALGGGCEIAMMCDFIVAAECAKFGQPEVKIGVIAGAGGTQRLTRAVGKAKAMHMFLSGRMMPADEAERSGLVAVVVKDEDLLRESKRIAFEIAQMSLPALMMTKEAVNRAFETTLSEGVRFERRLFHSMFSLADQNEGMNAFLEKRSPQFVNG